MNESTETIFLFLALYILIDYIIFSKDMYLLQTGMTVSSLAYISVSPPPA